MPSLRIIFMGTAELACPSLDALTQDKDFTVVAVVTQPDKPKGRELKLQPPPVKEAALKLNLPVLQPIKAGDAKFVTELAKLEPDLIVVAAYGQILPQIILDLPRHGCLNVHTSLLPKYRGAAPIQWAILNGDSETGVTIMKMDAGLDTGPILTQQRTQIEAADNAETLHDLLAQMGAELLITSIHDYIAGKITLQSQPAEGAVYARKLTKEDGELDWSQSASTLWNRVRALTPWPGAFTHLLGQPPVLLKVWCAEIAPVSGSPGEILRADKSGIVVGCSEGSLNLLEIQRESGRRMSAAEFLAGHELKLGDKLITAPKTTPLYKTGQHS